MLPWFAVLASWEMTPCAELTISIYSFGLPFSRSFFLHYQPAATNKHSALTTHLLLHTTPAATPVDTIQPTPNPRPTTQLLSQRATLRSSAISNASAYFCQPHSLPAINHPQPTFDDYYSRHHSQCLPPASLLALALPQPGLCHRFPNESFALAFAQTAKPC